MPIIAPKPEKLRCREHSARTRNSLVIKFRCSTPSDIVDIVPDDRSSNVAFSVITMYRSIERWWVTVLLCPSGLIFRVWILVGLCLPRPTQGSS